MSSLTFGRVCSTENISGVSEGISLIYFINFFKLNFPENISWVSGIKVSKNNYQKIIKKTKNYFSLRVSFLYSERSL